jgi:hypothetical protein
MTHKHTLLLAGIGACLLSSLAAAATPAPASAPASSSAPAPATAEGKVAAAPEPAPASKPTRARGDARKCLKYADNKSIRGCAEKYR